MKRTLSVALGTAALLFAGATATQAQISITPLIGGYIPASGLDEVKSGASDVAIERNGTLALGLNVDYGMLRGSLAYASGTTIQDADESDIGEGNVLAAAADIVIRPLPRLVVQPYLLGGIGLKNLRYDRDAGVANAFPDDDTEVALHAGIGADLMLGKFGIVAELTDYMSRDAGGSWGIHDAFLTAGVKYTLGN